MWHYLWRCMPIGCCTLIDDLGKLGNNGQYLLLAKVLLALPKSPDLYSLLERSYKTSTVVGMEELSFETDMERTRFSFLVAAVALLTVRAELMRIPRSASAFSTIRVTLSAPAAVYLAAASDSPSCASASAIVLCC